MLPESTNNIDEELTLLSASVRDYCSRSLAINRLRTLAEAQQSFDRRVWSEMADLGWVETVIPEGRGGLGYGAAGAAAVAFELGRVVAREPMLESGVFAASLLASMADNDARLTALRTGESVYSCPLSRSDWLVERTVTATGDGHAFVLDGKLDNLPFIDQADRVLFPVALDDKIALFDLPLDSPGLTVVAQVLADDSFAGSLDFNAARCDQADFIGFLDPENRTLSQAIAMLDLSVSAYLHGMCEALLERTLTYVRLRRQFGQAIGSFQALQHRLVDVYLQIRLTGAALRSAISAHLSDEQADLAAARARQRSTETALATVREAIQLHGAIGYTAASDVALYAWRMLVMQARFGGGLHELKRSECFIEQIFGSSVAALAAPTTQPPEVSADTDWNSLANEQFRELVRRWFQANYPESLRHLSYQVRWTEIRAWHESLVAKGWVAPAWPREHGGMGLDPAKLLVFIEELERHGVARAPDQGIVMLGPILFAYGTDDQRARFLAKALTGEHIWCQGYSEPNAGSDLASLTTRAVRDGDEFVVTGQKTWTTHGLDATHMYCLVRTDPSAKPQAGISFLLIDLNQPGVDIRPIPNLGGHVDFCEVFLDDVRVPQQNLVGEINKGWTIAKALLGHERLFVGSPKLCQHALNQLATLAERVGLRDDPVFVDAFSQATLDVLDLEALYAEFAELARTGQEFGADVALLKIWSSETYTRLSELIVKYSGPGAAVVGGPISTGIDAIGHYYNARPAPIYAGSNEIQRNIIAKHVLELPS